MRRKYHLVFGMVAAGLSASILAVDLPYYAVLATAAVTVLLVTWLTLFVREARAQAAQG
ncbi:heme A synthase [Nocardiopsis mwathae]|uniref:Heme A synthase n=1 Tax=Nocardiopsis mwathae TaxID=1472723 RepID=A0A7W9YKV4_9ACTN|nr:hypothetical protein [Nocardiopsis mwathae]MBB6174040.1 heme A synthase [Nocardiopsis mwathae]